MSMKKLLLQAAYGLYLLMPFTLHHAQGELTSAQVIQEKLSDATDRNELTRLNTGITAVLADARLTDLATRQMLDQSRGVLNEMLDQKVGSNVGKLVDFAKWMKAQAIEKVSIHEAGGTPTPQQQLVLDNPLAGEQVYLTSIIDRVLMEFLLIDGAAAGASKFESCIQLYLHFRSVVEGGTGIPDYLLLRAPEWMQDRFPQLTADQKRQMLKDINDCRAERDAEPAPDEEPAPPPTPQEQAAYEAAYQFILKNAPPPAQ